MVLTYDGYNETLEKDQEIQRSQLKYEEDIKALRKGLKPLLELKNTLISQGLLRES
jgi:hypothetical protein